MNIGIVGGSGYVGGELLRLLLPREDVNVAVVTSRRFRGEYVFRVHPNLRGLTDLRFTDVSLDEISRRCDIVFTAVPHGSSVKIVPKLLELGLRVIDLSADFRLKDPNAYEKWYGWKHPYPDLLSESVYGLPEIHRDEIAKARLVANPGCMATSIILALTPIVKAGFVDVSRIVVDVKIGSSGAGSSSSIYSHHSERCGVVRPYKPTSHRHIAEVEQELSLALGSSVRVAMTPHAVDLVRGILSTCHLFTLRSVQQIDLWRAYRGFYRSCPFIRIIKDSKGLQRLPDPKYVIGSNYCDIGFEIDERMGRVVVFSAIDNLMKGAAGQAVQNMNIMIGADERRGLCLPSIHPI
jgi:N-acetyl-gamma-glutamyl-phosphate/LysW-gamma-L-alpha-aminoadipyl-6-phosphate reductase